MTGDIWPHTAASNVTYSHWRCSFSCATYGAVYKYILTLTLTCASVMRLNCFMHKAYEIFCYTVI